MRRTRRTVGAAGAALGLAALVLTGWGPPAAPAGGAAPERRPPLAGLPSRPGPHVEKIKALGDNVWINLGKPAPDPRWGPAPGRSYTNKMAFAPDLRGAFLYGEGVHGAFGTGPREGYYNDDLFFYDINAHAWVCVHPGSNVKTLKMKLDANGFEVSEDGQHFPIAVAVHGYECTSYDPHRGQFMTLFTGSPYCRKVNERRREWLGDGKPLGREAGKHPFFYEVRTGRWERRKVEGDGPVPHFCRALWYIPSKKQTLFYERRTNDLWFYDHAANRWAHAAPAGPPPDFDHYEGVVCHDSKRDRLYIFNAGQTSVPWIYDIKTNTFANPQAKNQPYTARDLKAGRRSFASTTSMAHYDSVNDVVVVKLVVAQGEGDSRNVPNRLVGMAVYDPEQNEWRKDILPPPDLPQRRAWNGFYDPELGVHFYHLAGDSVPNGEIWVYRYKRAPGRN